MELLAIKFALFFFTKGKIGKTIHFQINNKAAFSYLLKVCERTNIWSNERRYLPLSSKSQYVYHSRILASSIEYSSRQRIKKKKIRLFRVASPSQSFSSGFPTMPSATSTYSLASRFLQSGDWCNDINLEHRSFLCISPFHYDFKSAPKNKTEMYSSSDSDCISLE